MVAIITNARNALAFLSRLVPPSPGFHTADSAKTQLADAVPFYPFAGLVLGALASVPVLLSLPTWLTAWLYTLLLAWMTRGLHWDGLADLADACGSNATGEKFWQIMKDSRIGAFGVMALVFGIGGQVLAVHTCLEKGAWLPLLLAPAYGRGMVILFGRLVRPNPHSTLAALIQPGLGKTAALAVLMLTFVLAALCLEDIAFGTALLLTAAILFTLRRIALAHDGANGDFHGSLIITAEIAILISGGLL